MWGRRWETAMALRRSWSLGVTWWGQSWEDVSPWSCQEELAYSIELMLLLVLGVVDRFYHHHHWWQCTEINIIQNIPYRPWLIKIVTRIKIGSYMYINEEHKNAIVKPHFIIFQHIIKIYGIRLIRNFFFFFFNLETFTLHIDDLY